jgi:hypothetical protein
MYSVSPIYRKTDERGPVTRNSRDKLNSIYGIFIIAVAAVIGAIAGSWVLFLLAAVGLFTVFAQTGQIRSPNDRKRNKRR